MSTAPLCDIPLRSTEHEHILEARRDSWCLNDKHLPNHSTFWFMPGETLVLKAAPGLQNAKFYLGEVVVNETILRLKHGRYPIKCTYEEKCTVGGELSGTLNVGTGTHDICPRDGDWNGLPPKSCPTSDTSSTAV